MKICICDDDRFAVREIRGLLEPFNLEDDSFSISDFSDGEALIDYYRNAVEFYNNGYSKEFSVSAEGISSEGVVLRMK